MGGALTEAFVIVRIAGAMRLIELHHVRRRLALAVSELPSEQPLVVKPFGHAFRGLDLFVGGTVQPDHSVIPVLSIPAAFARASRTANVPIMMVTSVDDDQQTCRALAAGADPYALKSTFEQAAFLTRVDTPVRGPEGEAEGP